MKNNQNKRKRFHSDFFVLMCDAPMNNMWPLKPEPTMERARELGWCNGMRFIARKFPNGKMDYLGILQALRAMALDPKNLLKDFDVDFWFTQPCFEGIGKQAGLSDVDYLEQVLDLAGEINRETKRPCLALHVAGELDSSSIWPYRFKTRKEAAEYWRRWNGKLHREVFAGQTSISAGSAEWRNLSENTPPDLFTFYQLKKRDIRQDPLYACCSRAWSVHQYYEWGIDTVECEANCFTPYNIQLQVAFLRGAARQFDGFWGLDFSPWGDAMHLGQKNEDQPTRYNQEGSYEAGTSASTLLRQWVISLMSGAHRILEEVSFLTHFVNEFKDTDEQAVGIESADAASAERDYILRTRAARTISPVGANAGIFADFALRKHRDRGRPYVPFGIILEHDHGWNSLAARTNEQGENLVPDNWPPIIWGGTIAPESGDHMITNFFRAAFSAWPCFYWTPGKWNPPPGKGTKILSQKKYYGSYWDKSNEEAVEAVLSGKLPIENLEQDMFLGNSRWGDSFDVVLENCSLEVLKDFQVLILLGRVKLTGDLLEHLKQYVAEGGTLVVNVLQLDAGSEEWLGVKTAEKVGKANKTKDRLSGTVFTERPFSYIPCMIDKAEVVAETDTGDGLIYLMSKGKGEVLLTTALYLQADDALPAEEEGMESRLLNIGVHLIDRLYQKVRIVAIEGPSIQSIVTRTGQSVKVTLINNYQTTWSGSLSWKNDASPLILRHKAFDCWREVPLSVANNGDTYTANLQIEPFGIRVVEIK